MNVQSITLQIVYRIPSWSLTSIKTALYWLVIIPVVAHVLLDTILILRIYKRHRCIQLVRRWNDEWRPATYSLLWKYYTSIITMTTSYEARKHQSIFLTLPDEVIQQIADHCSPTTLRRLRLVSHRLEALSNDLLFSCVNVNNREVSGRRLIEIATSAGLRTRVRCITFDSRVLPKGYLVCHLRLAEPYTEFITG